MLGKAMKAVTKATKKKKAAKKKPTLKKRIANTAEAMGKASKKTAPKRGNKKTYKRRSGSMKSTARR